MADSERDVLAEALREAFGCVYPRSRGGHDKCGVTDERIDATIRLLAARGWPLTRSAPDRPFGLDVERLAEALIPRHLFNHDGWICDPGIHERAALDFAQLVADAYRAAALAPDRPTPGPVGETGP